MKKNNNTIILLGGILWTLKNIKKLLIDMRSKKAD